MKNALLILLLGLMIAACSKSNDSTPNAGSQVAGNYTMGYIEADSAGTVLYIFAFRINHRRDSDLIGNHDSPA